MRAFESSNQDHGANHSRRRFLGGVAGGAAGLAAINLPTPLGAAKEVHHAETTSAPRSLVCVFLKGGADSANMFVPMNSSSYDSYREAKGPLAVSAMSLHPFGDTVFGLPPELSGLAELGQEGKVAVVRNVGPLHQPMTALDYQSSSRAPQLLFEHRAQQKLWLTGRQTLDADGGWGAALLGDQSVESAPAAFSFAGSTQWLHSSDSGYCRITSRSSAEQLFGRDPDVASVSVHETRTIATEVNKRMGDMTTSSLGGRLSVVAQLIAAREKFGTPRQVFYVELDGWDTHRNQAQRFPQLLQELNDGLVAFQRTLEDLGLADTTTTFTASEFGRTTKSIGGGTGHGWGGNTFVIGGSVHPGRYGQDSRVEDASTNGSGVFIPTTSVSQLGATFGRWMGLSDNQLDSAFPELRNFVQKDLGLFTS